MMRFRVTETSGKSWELGAPDESRLFELLQNRQISVRSIVRIDPPPAIQIWPRRDSTKPQILQQMVVTTTPHVEGNRITRYCGIVNGEAILGANLFKDLFAGIRDIVGGRSAAYERELQKARDIALSELQDRAIQLGANAVIGVDLDYEVLGQQNGMMMVAASGTAVVLERIQDEDRLDDN